MDYLTFGLLAGSGIVIISFLVRDAAPHLASLSPGSALGRLSRGDAPGAWERWCADVGLVVSAAGILVLLLTVGALLLGVADGMGTVVVALGLTVALVGAALGTARLTRRYRDEAAGERTGESLVGAWLLPMPTAASAVSQRESSGIEPSRMAPVVIHVEEPATLWDDELPSWSSSAPDEAVPVTQTTGGEGTVESGAPPEPFSAERLRPGASDDAKVVDGLEPPQAAPVATRRIARRPSERTPVVPEIVPAIGRPRDLPEPDDRRLLDVEPAATVAGGSFSSPLLADIGVGAVDADTAGFRSRLLLDLQDLDGAADDQADGGSDVLIDEAPAPASARPRDELA